MTNNFYDNAEAYPLPVKELFIDGEIANPGVVDFTNLPVRSVIVKETLLDSAGDDRFIGAYRYDGYSLFDILASSVSRIVPSKTKELWPLPAESKIVAASDLVTERNISSPAKITVKSYPHSFIVQQGMSPIYSSRIDIYGSSKKSDQIETLPAYLTEVTFNTVFYGRGKGIHSTTPFIGIPLKELLLKYYPVTQENLKSGMICIAGIDGYRSAVSYSELFNRNDQQEFLLIKTKDNADGGHFRIFAASDFFSDRAIKSVNEIHLHINK